MKEGNTKIQDLPFGIDYYNKEFDKPKHQSAGETLNKNKTTLEATNRKDEDKIFNERNPEEVEEFNDISNIVNDTRIIRVVGSDERINQPDEIKIHHVKNNSQNIIYLKKQLEILRKSSYELEKSELLRKIEIIENIIKIELTKETSFISLSDYAVKMKEIIDYQDELKKLESIKKNNEEQKKVYSISENNNNNNNNKDLQKTSITDLEIVNNESKSKNNDNQISNAPLNSSQINIKTEFTGKEYKKEEQTIDNKSDFDPISLIILLASFYTFPKYGRIPKNLKSIKKGKHDNKAKDNSRSKLFTSCSKSLDNFIKNEFKKYNVYLHCLTIKSQIGKNLYENEKFFEKKIIDIYFDSLPKRHNDNNYNKNHIKLVLKKEMDNDNIKIKLLNIVFNMEFEKIFKMYLYNIPYYIRHKNNKDYKVNLI